MKLVIAVLITLLSVGCFPLNEPPCPQSIDLRCFKFDIRQCQMDIFAPMIPESESIESREAKMKIWLESNGARIDKIRLILNYHEAACEACDRCPQGDKYVIMIISTTVPNIDSLKILNFEEADCCGFF